MAKIYFKDISRAFMASNKLEKYYSRILLNIAKNIRDILGSSLNKNVLERRLKEYIDMLTPWAETAAQNMVNRVNNINIKQWEWTSNKISSGILKELKTSAIGDVYVERILANKNLIVSIPQHVVDNLDTVFTQAMLAGERSEDLIGHLMQLGVHSANRARCIARTEISKTTTALTKARAEYIGSPGYIWRTSEDQQVRPSHVLMLGKYVDWNEPPTLDNMVGHAGEFPNCRCYPEVVFN